MSAVVIPFNRIFRDRLEVEHRKLSQSWIFELVHVSERGWLCVGTFSDVAEAFAVARAWRNCGVRIACVERNGP
jgi:hypothetical protein